MEEPKGNIQEPVKDNDMQVLEKYAASEIKSQDVSDTIAEIPTTMQRGTIYLIALAIVFCALILYFGKVAIIITAKGTIVPKDGDYTVKTYEGGLVVDIFAKAGDRLTKGSPLISTEPINKTSDNVLLSKEKIKVLESSIKLLTDQIIQEKSDLLNKKNRLEDYKKLLDRGLLSKIEFENEKERIYQSELSIRTKQKQIDETNLQIHTEAVAMEETEKKGAKTFIYMPVDGRILKLNVQHIGQSIMAGYDVAVIAPDNSPILIRAIVENKDIAFITLGQETRIKVDAYPFQQFGTLQGNVSQILPDVTQEGKFSITVEIQKQYFEVNETKHKVFSGLTVTSEIVTGYQPLYNLLFTNKEEKAAAK